ncbi:hotdog domain-containing protein [Frankia sp. Cas3]|uniref:PaaI family thioesterase n=1 Tax=Frankia sp. Cas3 TaxID=3073926 RepID=UPI002AD2A99E|nr:hotdog domain-containing protein [Frankia sp. Cas3]
MSLRDGTRTPSIGLSGQPIPFTSLVDVGPDPSSTGEPAFRLRPSSWLDGLIARGLPAPLVILADVAAGAAALRGRTGPERVVTEALRLDLLDRPSVELRAVASASASGPRRAMTVGVISNETDGGVVGHLTGRVAVLDPRQAGARVSAPSWVPPGDTPAVSDLLDDATELVQASDDMVRLRIPTHGDLGNSYGYMHGGAIAVINDVALEWLRRQPGCELAGSRVQSVSLDYLAPVPLTGTASVTSRVAERGHGRAVVLVGVAGVGGAASAVASYTVRLARS